MAFNTYTQLQETIARWLNREEENLDAAIPDMIAITESDLGRRLRAREMLAYATAAFTDGQIALPDDFLEMHRLMVGDRNLDYCPTYLHAQVRAATGADPSHYIITDNRLEILPGAPSGTATMVYYRAIPALTAPLASNWLLEKYPDLYLYGALVHSAGFLREDERMPLWQQAYYAAIAAVNESAELSAQRGGLLAMQY